MEPGPIRRCDGYHRQMAGRLADDGNSKLRTHESRGASGRVFGRYKCELCTGYINRCRANCAKERYCSRDTGCWSTQPSRYEGGIQGLDLVPGNGTRASFSDVAQTEIRSLIVDGKEDPQV